MADIGFLSPDTKTVYENYRFDICNQKYATPEGAETETIEDQVAHCLFYLYYTIIIFIVSNRIIMQNCFTIVHVSK